MWDSVRAVLHLIDCIHMHHSISDILDKTDELGSESSTAETIAHSSAPSPRCGNWEGMTNFVAQNYLSQETRADLQRGHSSLPPAP